MWDLVGKNLREPRKKMKKAGFTWEKYGIYLGSADLIKISRVTWDSLCENAGWSPNNCERMSAIKKCQCHQPKMRFDQEKTQDETNTTCGLNQKQTGSIDLKCRTDKHVDFTNKLGILTRQKPDWGCRPREMSDGTERFGNSNKT